MKLTAISGYGSKGPACFLFEYQSKRLLLDLGRGPDANRLPDLSAVGRVDAILFSHGHVDHTGGLHLAAALGSPPLYATEPAIALSGDLALKAAQPYEDLHEILGIPFISGSCGHAPGASWMRLGGDAGLLYTGDLSDESSLYRHTPLPKAAAVVFDAAYGVADVSLATQLEIILSKATGPLLLPAPAGGRGLEMALMFRAQGYRVALCAAHRRVAETLLTQARWLMPRGAEQLHDLLETTTLLHDDSLAAGIMIGAGPNAERDVTAVLAPRFIAEGSAQVIFTGHISEGTPAKAMVQSGHASFQRWNVHPRLTQQRAILAQSGASHVMPAFCNAATRADLAKALDFTFPHQPEMTW